MHTIPALFTAALFTAGTVGVVTLSDLPQDPRDFAGQAQVSLYDAIGKALAVQPGEAVEAELEMDDDALVYEIDIIADGSLREVKVDARSGSILENEVEDEPEELWMYSQILRHSEKNLQELVLAAGNVLKGTAFRAAFEAENRQPLCEVLFANGRNVLEVELEARAGHVIEIELEGSLPMDEWEENDGDEFDDEDEHDHDEEEEEEEDR